jgi:hypothetical protein
METSNSTTSTTTTITTNLSSNPQLPSDTSATNKHPHTTAVVTIPTNVMTTSDGLHGASSSSSSSTKSTKMDPQTTLTSYSIYDSIYNVYHDQGGDLTLQDSKPLTKTVSFATHTAEIDTSASPSESLVPTSASSPIPPPTSTTTTTTTGTTGTASTSP